MENLNFEEIRNHHYKLKKLFQDPDFPANSKSLGSELMDPSIKWKRPHELVSNPRLYVDGSSRFDIEQGNIGDCWLMAAIANLAQHPELFQQVVPARQGFESSDKYAGIFRFRFWQYGKWVEVVIDDRLPTRDGHLIYMQPPQKNEFWGPLLEKAYAKLFGSYSKLCGGFENVAMESFSNGVCEEISLICAPKNLFQILLQCSKRESMMGCSLNSDEFVTELRTSQQLVRGHAYSITKVSVIEIETPEGSGKIPMIRIRNPWGGRFEWNGPWSDGSPEWKLISDDKKKELGLVFEHDGEFWMTFRDFVRHFDEIEICSFQPKTYAIKDCTKCKQKWTVSTFEGHWARKTHEDTVNNFVQTLHMNPQYMLILEHPDELEDKENGKCTVLINLIQKKSCSEVTHGCYMDPMQRMRIGAVIYDLNKHDIDPIRQDKCFFEKHVLVAQTEHSESIQVTARFQLPVGKYMIVPATDPDKSGQYMLRVFTESCHKMQLMD